MNRFKLSTDQKIIMKVCGNGENCQNLAFTFSIKGKLDLKKFEWAIQQTVNNNDVFRFKIHRDPVTGEVYQSLAEEVNFKLDVRKTQGDTYEERYKDVGRQILQIVTEAELLDQFAWEFVLFDMGEDNYMFYGRMNHIVFDGVSISLTFENMMSYYNDIPVKTTLNYLDYIKEQEEFKASAEYQEMERSFSELSDTMQNFDFIYNQFKDSERPSDKSYKNFVTVGSDELNQFCRQHKMSLFHVNLFLLHAAAAIVYHRADSAIVIPSGLRKIEYMNTIGSIMGLAWSHMVFDDAASVRDLAVLCRNNYFKNVKASSLVTDILLDNDYPIDFYITYQNHITNMDLSARFGDAEVKMVVDATFGKQKAELKTVIAALSALEVDKKALCGLICDEAEFPVKKVVKIYELLIQCLIGEDKTFGEVRQLAEAIK